MNVRKYLFFFDALGQNAARSRINECARANTAVEAHELTDEAFPDRSALLQQVRKCLSAQKIGTFLHVYAAWELLQPIRQMAAEIGFAEKEMELVGFGEKAKNVFCPGCQKMSTAAAGDAVLICRHCGLKLSVSSHYSRRLDAYLGYAVIPYNGKESINRRS
jgi:hypothetical protein